VLDGRNLDAFCLADHLSSAHSQATVTVAKNRSGSVDLGHVFAAGCSVLVHISLVEALVAYRLHPWHGVVRHGLREASLPGISAIAIGLIILCFYLYGLDGLKKRMLLVWDPDHQGRPMVGIYTG